MVAVMLKRYRYELNPGPAARAALARTFGSARVVFNDFVADNRTRYGAGEKFRGYSAAANVLLTQAKQTPERAWLSEVSIDALQQSMRDADAGYRNFFNSVSGRRKGRRVSAPKFKSRHDSRQSCRFTTRGFRIRGGHTNSNPGGGHLNLAKVGNVRVRWSRPLPAAPTSVTVVRESDGRYFASFVVDVPALTPVPPVRPGRIAGLDMGLSDFATVVYSDGTREKIANPRFFRASQRRLAAAQKSLSRKAKGSTNRQKAKARVATLHRHVANQRLNHAHQVASTLIRENQTVSIENLSITGMVRTRLAKSVSDVGWGQFLRILEEKTVDHGRVLHQVPRNFASTQICAPCGHRGGPKPLHVREWKCSNCGAVLDRDYNAAANMCVAARLAETENDCGEDVRRALTDAALIETVTRPIRNAA